jgi:hypothetical protein
MVVFQFLLMCEMVVLERFKLTRRRRIIVSLAQFWWVKFSFILIHILFSSLLFSSPHHVVSSLSAPIDFCTAPIHCPYGLFVFYAVLSMDP